MTQTLTARAAGCAAASTKKAKKACGSGDISISAKMKWHAAMAQTRKESCAVSGTRSSSVKCAKL